MKKESRKSTESQLLELLKAVLPKATPDAKLAGRIYASVEKELQSKNRALSFAKFCERVELPDLSPGTVSAVKKQLSDTFPDADVAIKADVEDKRLAVEVSMPDGTRLTSEVKVRPLAADDTEEPVFRFAPFPVSLPGDSELVWLLAKRENMTPAEAAAALTKIEDDFWGSKTGQKLLRDRVERCFPEFIARAPAGMLGEFGLKRHYKTPEPVKSLRTRVAKQ